MDIARMLLEHGADPNKRYFFGAEINLVTDLEFLELLLTFGANPDSRDRSGLTPLMKAVRQPQVRLLMDNYFAASVFFLKVQPRRFVGHGSSAVTLEIWSGRERHRR